MTSTAVASAPELRSNVFFRRAALTSFVWLIVALVFITQNYLGVVARHEQPRWLLIAGFELEYWLTFLAFSPFFVFMASRFPVGRDGGAANVWAHIMGGTAFALVQPVASDALHYITLMFVNSPDAPVTGQLADMIVRYPVLALIALWKYAVVIAVYHTIDYSRRHREHEVRAAQLESRLALAQIGALRMELQPHFLFNALNSVSALTLSDPTRAHDVLAQLGSLLRETLAAESHADVTLAQELDFLDRYLGIERVRFEERLIVQFEIPAALESALVPSLILQPLVENVIHHALAPSAVACTLVIRAMAEGTFLRLDVEDDGPGLPRGWTVSRSARTGLANVQARVSLANAVPRPMEFHSRGGKGLCVRLMLPLRYADAG